jgi:hypothetical protein
LLLDNILAHFLCNFTDEFIECRTSTDDEMKLRNDRLHAEVAHDGASRAVEEWQEREVGVFHRPSRPCHERDVLLEKELAQAGAGLTVDQENELQELNNHNIEFEDSDIAILRESLAEANGNLTCATKAEKRKAARGAERTWTLETTSKIEYWT